MGRKDTSDMLCLFRLLVCFCDDMVIVYIYIYGSVPKKKINPGRVNERAPVGFCFDSKFMQYGIP